jgi:hypothetical protein
MKHHGAILALLAVVILTPLASNAQACQLFAAALEVIGSKPDSTILIDQTVMGVPGFAFHAYTGMRRGDTTLRQAETDLRALNATRTPIPSCMVDSLGWRIIPDTVLIAFFAKDGGRWPAFRAAHPATPRFALISQPIIKGDTAVIFVANASDNLAGQGVIVQLIREAGRWIRRSSVLLWVS